MKLENTMPHQSFYKGSLPTWILVLLMGSITFTGRRLIGELDELKARWEANQSNISSNTTRVSVLESESKALKDSISDLKLSQRDILIELKNINVQLRK